MRQLAARRRLSQRNVLACGLTTEPGSGRTRTGLFFCVVDEDAQLPLNTGLRLSMKACTASL